MSKKVQGTSLQWTDINFTLPENIKSRRREILSGQMSGMCQAGKLICILGPSGSGKTTLLNLLAGRFSQSSVPGSKVTGTVSINGRVIDPVEHKHHFAYVLAEDALYPTMTPREALTFAACLRLPKSARTQIPHRVQDLLDTLGLEKCADSLIGNELVKGISTGEKKRTAVGVELVTDPEIVFLDEPTSGLDSYTAYSLIKGPLRTLAKGGVSSDGSEEEVAERGRVVLCTIHQPSSEIFYQFDECIVISGEGKMVFFGPTKSVGASSISLEDGPLSPCKRMGLMDYFTKAGFPCSKEHNPADHALLLVQTLEDDSINNLLSLCENDPAVKGKIRLIEDIRKTALGMSAVLPEVSRNSFGLQFKLLLGREFRNFFRDKSVLGMRVGGTMFMSVVASVVFLGVGNETPDAAGRIGRGHFGGLTMVTTNGMMLTAMASLVAFPAERPVFLREYNASMYNVEAYFLAKSCVDIPAAFIQATLMVSIVYALMELQGLWALEVVALWTVAIAASSLGVALGCFAADVKKAMETAPLLFIPQIMFSGFFIKIEQIPAWMRWIQYICPLKYAMNVMMIAEFEDLEGGSQLLAANNVNADHVWLYVVILLCLIIGFRIIGMVGLKKRARKSLF